MHNFNFNFLSSDHKRYENGQHVSGPHGGAPRLIKFSDLDDKILVVIVSPEDGAIMMGGKSMKVVSQSETKVTLRGFGDDGFGESFANYGVTIDYLNKHPVLCTLHMYDRNIDIVYMLDDKSTINNKITVFPMISNQGGHFLRQLLPQYWDKLNNFNGAQIEEINDEIKIHLTNGLTITASNNVVKQDEARTYYKGSLSPILDKPFWFIKVTKSLYEIWDYDYAPNQGGFFIILKTK